MSEDEFNKKLRHSIIEDNINIVEQNRMIREFIKELILIIADENDIENLEGKLRNIQGVEYFILEMQIKVLNLIADIIQFNAERELIKVLNNALSGDNKIKNIIHINLSGPWYNFTSR